MRNGVANTAASLPLQFPLCVLHCGPQVFRFGGLLVAEYTLAHIYYDFHSLCIVPLLFTILEAHIHTAKVSNNEVKASLL